MGDKKILLGTLLFIADKGKVLLIKRKKHPYIGYWGMPGGKIDFGEHPEETAVREAKEETGIGTEFVKVRGILSELIRDRQSREITDQFIMFVCELKPSHTSAVSSDEGELEWFGISEIQNIKIIPSEADIINKIALGKGFVDVHKSHVLNQGGEYFLEMFGK